MRYRKKPVEVEAMIFNENNQYEIIRWVHDGLPPEASAIARSDYKSLIIRTLEGEMRALCGDYIIKGVQGEFYPCKPDIFEQTYEPV